MGSLKTDYIFKQQVRSVLELPVLVWQAGLTCHEITYLERIQKAVCHIILGDKYFNYNEALIKLNIQTLQDRGIEIYQKFAHKASLQPEFKDWFNERDFKFH